MSVLIDKKTKRLFIQFNFKGKTYKKRLPEDITKKEAEKLEVKFKNNLFFESNGIAPKKEIVFEDFLSDYFLPFAIKHYTPDSYKNVKIICKCLLKFVKGRVLRHIRAAEIERFKNYRQDLKTLNGNIRKPATIVRELGIVSKIFSFAVLNEFLEFNPCSRVSRPVCDNLQDKILTGNEEILLLENIKTEWAREIVILILNTGLRQNDALGLTKFNIDWQNRSLRLLQGKTQRKVVIPINNTVFELLSKNRHNGSDYFFPSPKTGEKATSIKRTLERACQRAKIDKIGTRVLRRTFATRLSEKNYSSSVKAKLLGHSDLRSVVRYERESDILREAVESLDQNSAKILPLALKTNDVRTINS